MKPDEEFCQTAYHRFLKEQGFKKVEWDDGTEPPDYFVEVDGIPRAVEVTRVIGTTQVGSQPMSNQMLDDSLHKAFEMMKQRIQTTEPIAGTYLIHIQPTPNMKETIPSIESEAREYMRDTRHCEIAPYKRLPGNWRIRKVAGAPSLLAHAGMISGFKWEIEANDELQQLLTVAVQKKVSKLSKLVGPIALLLFDEYRAADKNTWTKFLPQEAKLRFDWILRIGWKNDCQLIWEN